MLNMNMDLLFFIKIQIYAKTFSAIFMASAIQRQVLVNVFVILRWDPLFENKSILKDKILNNLV